MSSLLRRFTSSSGRKCQESILPSRRGELYDLVVIWLWGVAVILFGSITFFVYKFRYLFYKIIELKLLNWRIKRVKTFKDFEVLKRKFEELAGRKPNLDL